MARPGGELGREGTAVLACVCEGEVGQKGGLQLFGGATGQRCALAAGPGLGTIGAFKAQCSCFFHLTSGCAASWCKSPNR